MTGFAVCYCGTAFGSQQAPDKAMDAWRGKFGRRIANIAETQPNGLHSLHSLTVPRALTSDFLVVLSKRRPSSLIFLERPRGLDTFYNNLPFSLHQPHLDVRRTNSQREIQLQHAHLNNWHAREIITSHTKVSLGTLTKDICSQQRQYRSDIRYQC